MRQDMD